MTAETQGEFISVCQRCPSKNLLGIYIAYLSETNDKLRVISHEGCEQAEELIHLSQLISQGATNDLSPEDIADVDQQYSEAIQIHTATQAYVSEVLFELGFLKTAAADTTCTAQQSCKKLEIVQCYTRALQQ